MRRVLEPEYMDSPEEASSYAAMDHAAVNAAFVDRFLQLGGDTCQTAVDLGTGPGDIPLELARRSAIPTIVGVDAAASMLALARPKAEAAGLAGRVRFDRADVKALPYGNASFDGVFSNTILHHIPEPVDFLREAARVLAPGGVLLIRDLYRPATMDEAKRLVELHAANESDEQQQLLLQSLCAALTLGEARACADQAGLQRATVAMNSDRHYSIEIGR
jgi:ubiquinone/menaquinone biosynthesis C-methylase UbiE